MKQIVIIPIDNRPVTYVYPQLVARIAGIEALVPPRELMGSLSNNTRTDELVDWIVKTLKEKQPQAMLLCADSIIYGGLIPSRRMEATAPALIERTKIFSQFKKLNKKLQNVLVQSSIMRISDNYDNTEEKEYWSKFGREIYAWSEALHQMQAVGTKHGAERDEEETARLQRLEAAIDADVREDYLSTRRRNFQINKKLLDFVASGDIDFLIFSQDDSGQYGLNVLEKERLITDTQLRKLRNVVAYPGADEVMCTMLARWMASAFGTPNVGIVYSPESGAGIASRYEGQSIGESVKQQLSAVGISPEWRGVSPDMQLIVHTSGERQGDHIMLQGQPDIRHLDTFEAVDNTLRLIAESSSPVILCDVAYSNGADPSLIEKLLEQPELLRKVWGYAGWNTTGNTLGSAIATAVARWVAETQNYAHGESRLREALFVRLADDWAYQAMVRKELSNGTSEEKLPELMAPYLSRVEAALEYRPDDLQLTLPWQRTFEVEIGARLAAT
jgi:hypothetical protein